MKNLRNLTIIAMVAVLALAGCNRGRAEAQEGGGAGGGSSSRTARVAPESDFTVELTRDSAGVRINRYNGSAAAISIPATIQGLPLREIARDAFRGNTTITTVIIPEGVTIIGADAFRDCTNLTYVSLPGTLTNLAADSVWGGVFRNTALTSFPDTWPAAITTIGPYMFCGTKIRELLIPEGITSIGNATFEGIDSLVSVTLPSTLREITPTAFVGSRNINLASQAAIRAIEPRAMF
ncbi:MAG: leucine-rich repeat domain-containing protein [Treponema sp.]|nr:leucine-rich repeat domain-containing protein [Treponema sp.]